MLTENVVRDESGDPVLEEVYSVATGTVITVNTKTKEII
jgi:aconitate hydratase 2/2-methylisocitrate dehydratase